MEGITDRAGKRLMAALREVNASSPQCPRYRICDAGEEEMKLDRERPGDHTFEYQGRKVLAVDAITAVTLAGRALDYREGKFCLV